MRLTEDKIKAGILHPDRDVRDAAVLHFSRSECHDLSVMPLAIQAIEQYGWEGAFTVPSVVEGLPLSDETLLWIVRQIQREDVFDDDTMLGRGWRGALAWLLCDAEPNLLARHQSEIVGIKGLGNNDIDLIETRIDLLTVNAEMCWGKLEVICHQTSYDSVDPNANYGYALVEAIARSGDAARVLSYVAEKSEDVQDYGEGWMELFMVNLAGEMRLDAAVPHIVAKLLDAEEEADLLFDQGEQALVKIGTDAAVEGAATLFAQGDLIQRMNACHVFEHVHSDLAVTKALELLPNEGDVTIKTTLAQALISQFAYEGIEPVRELVLSGDYDLGVTDLRRDLIAATTLMEVDLPENEAWRGDIEKDRNEAEKQMRLRAEPPSEDEYEEEPLPPPKKKVGRNDPCPCGSGRKFKQCCMKKQGG
jgi:hypothetical protein